MKWTITPEIKDALKKIADEKIPATELKGKNGQPIPIVQQVRGWQLIEKGQLKDPDGKKFIPSKKYYLEIGNKKIDHYPDLEKAFIQGGYDKVNELYRKLINK